MPRGFSVVVGHGDDGEVTVAVHGELDLATSPALEHTVQDFDGGRSTIVVDLTDVPFMDSTGLRALWTLRQRVAVTGGRMLLRSPSPSVFRVLQTTKLDKVFDYAATTEAV